MGVSRFWIESLRWSYLSERAERDELLLNAISFCSSATANSWAIVPFNSLISFCWQQRRALRSRMQSCLSRTFLGTIAPHPRLQLTGNSGLCSHEFRCVGNSSKEMTLRHPNALKSHFMSRWFNRFRTILGIGCSWFAFKDWRSTGHDSDVFIHSTMHFRQ